MYYILAASNTNRMLFTTRLHRNNKYHNLRGQAIAEAPVAIMLLCIVALPIVWMLLLLFGYFCGWYLNYLQTHYAAGNIAVVVNVKTNTIDPNPPANETDVYSGLDTLTQNWVSSPLGTFIGALSTDYPPQKSCIMTYLPYSTTYTQNGVTTSVGNATVTVATKVTSRLPLPFIGNPQFFNYSSTRIIENTSQAGP